MGKVSSIVDRRDSPSQIFQTQVFTCDERDRLRRGYTTGSASCAYDESYAYDLIRNLTAKGSTSYSYPGSRGRDCRCWRPMVGSCRRGRVGRGRRDGRGGSGRFSSRSCHCAGSGLVQPVGLAE